MSEPLYLPNVTMIAVTDCDHGKTVEAILKSLQHIKPAKTLFLTDTYIGHDSFETIIINPLRSAKAYNEFITWKLAPYIETSHVLLVQHDGYVLDASVWTDEFLEYDYIGAPWTYTDGRNVGNGGFSLRSKRLHEVLATDPFITVGSPEDEIICRLFRGYLETHHNIRYAPDALAHRFSFEMHKPRQKTFGFHNYFHTPYREPIVLKRSYAMGDVIMLEPVMEHFYKKGYRVILDTQPHLYQLFANHPYPVEHVAYLKDEDVSEYRHINFDMAYEINPKQLALKSYFDVTGEKDYVLRNSKLNFPSTPTSKLFDKYAVLHIKKGDLPYRNVEGVNWDSVALDLTYQGYIVLQVGDEYPPIKNAIRINTTITQMLAFVIGGADLFIGMDSGPAHIAVACGVKSMIFFGSVNPAYRYHDLSNVIVMQNGCVFAGCYHNAIGVKGADCVISKDVPPCTVFTTEKVIRTLKQNL